MMTSGLQLRHMTLQVKQLQRLFCNCCTATMSSSPVVVVHGGAGVIIKERVEMSQAGVQAAARAGYACLQDGGSAVDAVVEAVTHMENNPVFNAGCGSVLTQKGTVEMDAIVMDGLTLDSGAVSAVKNIANPVQLARLVMEKTSVQHLTAEGASQFAKDMGVPEVPEESLITEFSRRRWEEYLTINIDTLAIEVKMGTVGAVAVDQHGNVASATSSGGRLSKIPGRVGDVPLIGCGAYADNHVGAVSCTGHGECNMRVILSRLVLFYMEQGKSAQEAADQALAYMNERVQGQGGLLVVDPKGNWVSCFSTSQMPWAAVQGDTLYYGIYKGENFTKPIPP